MLQDFRTQEGCQTYGVRASGLIIKDKKIFLTRDKKGIYYTIGGAIKVGESTERAVQREIFEEIGIKVQVNQLAFIVENKFLKDGVSFHNIEFHYLVTPLSEPANIMIEDGEEQPCDWIEIDNLDKIDLRPKFLRTLLPNWQGEIVHIKSEGE